MSNYDHEEWLTGGNVSSVYRSGDIVRRELKSESTKIHELLKHWNTCELFNERMNFFQTDSLLCEEGFPYMESKQLMGDRGLSVHEALKRGVLMSSNPKLPLTELERTNLRRNKVKLSEIHLQDIDQLAELFHSSTERAKVLKGLAEFQTVPSIGYKLADKVVNVLKIYSLKEIKSKNAATLFDRLERKLGVWTDGCVEDQIRCVIHYANDKRSTKQWFDFTDERKKYREELGYPHDRPERAWYE